MTNIEALIEARARTILALDTSEIADIRGIIEDTLDYVGTYKAGPEIMTAYGTAAVVKYIKSYHARVMLDMKLNDIPNTVGRTAALVAGLGVDMLTVHASAGIQSMKAAVDNKGKTKILAVTVLTTIQDDGLDSAQRIFGMKTAMKVIGFAADAVRARVDGLISSPRELSHLTGITELNGKLKVTPGVRPAWAESNDQKRFTTPGCAIRAGADYIILGRPIIKPPQGMTRKEAADRVIREVASALMERDSLMQTDKPARS